MREEIRALQQRHNLTVLYVTHDQSEALAVSDQIVVMRNAEIAQLGTPAELYMQPNSVFVATFMGEANHVKGALVGTNGEMGEVALDMLRIALPHRGLPQGPVDIVIRPEAIRVLKPEATAGLPAKVGRATYMGSHTEYHLLTSLGELFAISPERVTHHRAGDSVLLSFDPEGVVAVRP